MNIRLPHWNTVIAIALLTMVGCSATGHNLPPASRLMEPGPGVGGPGPGVIPAASAAMAPIASVMHPQHFGGHAFSAPTVQVLFASPESLQVQWDISGIGSYDSVPQIAPARVSFPQGALYRLKLTNIPGPGNEGLELYPTVEVAQITPRTASFLDHNALPVQFTPEDFEQVQAGNFVTKVIYLPDPEFQLAAVAAVETLVSTRLNLGEDPITEADRRGSIMAVVRMGNKDLELPGTVGGDMVAQASYGYGVAGADCYGCNPMTGIPPQFVAGVTAPLYGMPMSGTPIGLPGPPHIPLGAPAGLREHTMWNHTRMSIPEPSRRNIIHVQQRPGFSYPTQANRVFIQENSFRPTPAFRPMGAGASRSISSGGPCGICGGNCGGTCQR